MMSEAREHAKPEREPSLAPRPAAKDVTQPAGKGTRRALSGGARQTPKQTGDAGAAQAARRS